ncbi:MAG: tripartite tricarboxylate transporter permease [Planctomycetota bacterium]|nr:tripartite tricarboxylate transporter permease [Planctomycetota bacterium]
MTELAAAFEYLFQPGPLMLVALGTVLGIIVGAIPGLTGAMLIALTLPLTFSMNHANALALLVSMYVGAVSGGLITATLLRMPGTPASMMTTLDGYPMARNGKPGRALGLGITASVVGGLISWVVLALLARPMAHVSTQLGPFELFALVLTALVLISSVSTGSQMAGIFSGLLGILAAMPGTSPIGEVRMTGGFTEVDAGFQLLPVLIGLFAISQIVQEILRIDQPVESVSMTRKGMFMSLSEWRRQAVNLIRSSMIGTWIGILPGIGANIGSVVAYSAAKNSSRNPEDFGKGCDEGIIASESANNATVGGALIPLVSLGVPGSLIDAILLGALVIHGLQPGPLLFANNPLEVNTIIATVLVANVFMFAFMFASVGWLSRLMYVPRALLLPAILACCVIGTYALSNRGFDVGVMLAFGAIGFVMDRLKIPLAPFVIGFVLAPIAEKNLCAGLMLSGGSYAPLVTRPISLVFVLVSFALLIWPIWKRRRPPLTDSIGE